MTLDGLALIRFSSFVLNFSTSSPYYSTGCTVDTLPYGMQDGFAFKFRDQQTMILYGSLRRLLVRYRNGLFMLETFVCFYSCTIQYEPYDTLGSTNKKSNFFALKPYKHKQENTAVCL